MPIVVRNFALRCIYRGQFIARYSFIRRYSWLSKCYKSTGDVTNTETRDNTKYLIAYKVDVSLGQKRCVIIYYVATCNSRSFSFPSYLQSSDNFLHYYDNSVEKDRAKHDH